MKRIIDIHLFTDGACSGNPGPGGWGFILRHVASGKEREGSGGEAETTNNRMELRAVVEGLRRLTRPCSVELFTDSVYVGKGLSQWIRNWKKNDWHRREHDVWVPVKNDDLWRLLDELATIHRIKYTRVAGHSGHPENERCDYLAVTASRQQR